MSEESSTEPKASLPARLLGGTVATVVRHPRLIVWLVLIVACAAVGASVSHLQFRWGRDHLTDPAAAFSQHWELYSETFDAKSDLVVVVDLPEPDAPLLREALTAIGSRMEEDPEHFSGVLYEIDQSRMRRKGLQYLTDAELDATLRRVNAFAPVLREGRWDLIRTEALAKRLRLQMQQAEEAGATPENLYLHAQRLAVSLNRFLRHSRDSFRYHDGSFRSPWVELMSVEADDSVADADTAYLVNQDQTVGLVQAFPVEQPDALSPCGDSIQRLREIVAEVRSEFAEIHPDMQISVTGIPVLEHDELQAAQSDMLLAAGVAFGLVGLLMFFGLKSVRHPMLALMSLLVAMTWTLGLVAVVIGHLNVLSICFGAILIGLGIDFSIHFLARYINLRQELYEPEEALALTARTSGTGILTSAVTTALAFGSAALTGFPGLAELGIVSGMGILCCVATTFLFLPALVALSDADVDIESIPQLWNGSWFRKLVARFPTPVLALGVLIVAAGGMRAFDVQSGAVEPRITYDSNLLKLHDDRLESVLAQQRLRDSSERSLLYAVVLADSQEEAVALREEFLALPTVGRVSELASRLPQMPTTVQQNSVRQLKTALAATPQTWPAYSQPRPSVIGPELDRLYNQLRRSPNLTARNAAVSLDEFLNSFASLSADKQVAFLEAYQNLLTGSLLEEFDQVADATELTPVGLEDLPVSLRDRYLRRTETGEAWLLRIYPAMPVWDQAPLTAFVEDLRSVRADVSGIPVQNYESAVRLEASCLTIALYSVAIIAVLLLVEFLRPGQKALTILPPVLVTAFIGYTLHQRSGELQLHLLVAVCLGMIAFIASVLDYRNLRDTVLALVPAAGGILLMLGGMAAIDLHFNPINIIVLPLVLGIGVDDGIHLVHDYRRQMKSGRDYVPGSDAMIGVVLTSLTSIVGFGSLMLSGHQGLYSVGAVMALGVAGSLIVAVIPLPALLALAAHFQPASTEPVQIARLRTRTEGEAEGEQSKAEAKESSSSSSGNGKQQSRKQRRAA